MKRILIIDDESEVRASLAKVFDTDDYEACIAESAAEGIALAKEKLPDLILCDIAMPDGDGYGVLAALRADPRFAATPFVFLTARTARSDQRLGMNLGADDYITKPFTASELHAAVTARLRRAEQQTGTSAVFTAQRLESLGLTAREAEVLFWLAQGKTNLEIGTILALSLATVKTHLGRIFEKLGVENRTTAVIRALETILSPA